LEIQHHEPAAARQHGSEQFGFEGMLPPSVARGWSGLSAQLCTNICKGVIPWRTPQSDIRICVDIHGNESVVTRRAPGFESRIIARRGTVWLSPPGLQDGSIDIAEDMTGIVHIYLPLSHFSPGNFDVSIGQVAVGALSYERAFEDPLLAEIGCAIAAELQAETSAGSLLVGALASSLAARLVQKHVSASSAQSFPGRISQGLDRRRLLRVVDYIEANLEGDLSLERMATRQAEIDTAVKRMQADAAAAEKKLQKHVDQMGTQSWSALTAVLTETRAAFDRANQAARDAFKRAA